MMREFFCTMVSADESKDDVGQVDAGSAVDVFYAYPWEEQVGVAATTGVSPSLTFAIGENGKEGYMNVTGVDHKRFSIEIEVYKQAPIFGFIPRRKPITMDFDGVAETKVEECLNNFFRKSEGELLAWVEKGHN